MIKKTSSHLNLFFSVARKYILSKKLQELCSEGIYLDLFGGAL